MSASDVLLEKVMAYATSEGIADKSLREIAAGIGSSHRMLLYHFGSREGLLIGIVSRVEQHQRDVLAALAQRAGSTPAEVMLGLWRQVSDPALRPYVRLFFAVVGLAVQGVPGTTSLLDALTTPWLSQGAELAQRLGLPADPVALRLAVATTRGLLLELLGGADPEQVDAAYQMLVRMWEQYST
jgi:AcrR family transcriptional regulator